MASSGRSKLGPNLRMLLAGSCFSAWLVLLLSGHRFGGAIFLLFLAALVLFPWRAVTAEDIAPVEPIEENDPQ